MDPISRRRRTWLAFSVWGAGLCIVLTLVFAVARAPERDGVAGPLRSALELNGRVWHALFSTSRTTGEYKAPVRTAPRFNGDIGLDTDGFDPATWRLNLAGPGVPQALSLRIMDLQWMPPAESSAEFRCIEGWSEPISYKGLRFSDFMRRFDLGRRSGAPWPNEGLPDDLYPYVGMETPDGEYYVSIDMESMLHPQTMLAWEMNGEPLSNDNGFPLRLVIPVKYGIKNLKRIGKIFFSDTRPRDYWAEQGYDWFAGL